MFTVQNFHQVLLPLSQSSTSIPKKWILSCKKSSSSHLDINAICSTSLLRTLKNWQLSDNASLLKQLSSISVETLSHFNLCLLVNTCLKFPLDLVKHLQTNHVLMSKLQVFSKCFELDSVSNININRKVWSRKFVSNNGFDENKRESDLLGHAHSFKSNMVLVRGFKTERTIEAESFRNPSLWGRFQLLLGINPAPHRGTFTNAPNVRGLVHDIDKLRETALDQTLSEDERQRIKVAFAEGYLVHSQQNEPSKTLKWLKLIQHVLTLALFLGLIYVLMASSGSMFRFQIGNQTEVDPEEIRVTFDDVKGADEAKQELKDVVEFLKNPERFSSLGAKLPKGVLLVGLPGTGKTLLARAVAGEAGVPFFHAAGPEFDEILVGQGARRVRDLFKAAKERAPCVVFIDEIDSVGSKRTNSVLHPYANQTINQLLTEMDGFRSNEGVIVLGATNRRDDLDRALLRPGRFDVEVTVPTPDFNGRKDILKLYLQKVQSKEVNVDLLARGTTGFTGADLENMVNQAAIRAAFDGSSFVTMKHLDIARDKVLMGPEKKTRLPDDEENLITAYHEGGHAIVSYFTKESDSLHKVTIMPRGPSLGHTAYIPEKESYHVTKSKLLAIMDTLMGGRAAEELVFGPDKVTSGASSDLTRATSIATHMVKEWGMSEKVGLRSHESKNASFIAVNELGQTTNDLIDAEIKKIMQESYERAKTILRNHSKEHKLIAEALMKYETLTADDIRAIMTDKSINEKKTPA